MSGPTGKKNDSEKPRVELLSSIALIEIAKVMTFGAKKYDSHNWRGGIAWSRVLGAALRHLLAFLGGESKDPETGLSHLAHLACCTMFLLEYQVTHPELDDRYKTPEKHTPIDKIGFNPRLRCVEHPYDSVIYSWNSRDSGWDLFSAKCNTCSKELYDSTKKE